MTSFQLVTLDFWENVYNNVSYFNFYLLAKEGVSFPRCCLPATSAQRQIFKKPTVFLLEGYIISILVIPWQAEQIEFDFFLRLHWDNRSEHRPGCTRSISLIVNFILPENNFNRFVNFVIFVELGESRWKPSIVKILPSFPDLFSSVKMMKLSALNWPFRRFIYDYFIVFFLRSFTPWVRGQWSISCASCCLADFTWSISFSL